MISVPKGKNGSESVVAELDREHVMTSKVAALSEL